MIHSLHTLLSIFGEGLGKLIGNLPVRISSAIFHRQFRPTESGHMRPSLNRHTMNGQENHQTIDGPYYNVTKASQIGDKRKSEDDGPPQSDKKTKRNRYISIAWWGPPFSLILIECLVKDSHIAATNANVARSSAMDKILANDVATCLSSVSTLPIARALPASKTHRKHLSRIHIFMLTNLIVSIVP